MKTITENMSQAAIESLLRVLKSAEALSAAMVETEGKGVFYTVVEDQWQELTAAIVHWYSLSDRNRA